MTAAPAAMFIAANRVLASAGSGKTYQLTSRYLDLLARGARPSGILATTFTRAAAGEIRNRVMMRLVESVHDSKKRVALGEAIGQPAMTAGDAVALLRTIAANLHRLQIRTLDSFFASIVQTFALDLGLPAGCRIVEDSEIIALREEAVARLLDEENPQPMIDLLRHLTTKDGGRAVHETIDQQVAELYELFRETTPGAWDAINPPAARLTDSELIDAMQRLRGVALPNHKSIAQTHGKYCELALQRDWDSFVCKGIPGAMLAGGDSFWGKPITPEMASAYHPLIQHACGELIERERRRNRAAQRLLILFDQHFTQLKHRDGVVTFSDLAPQLAGLLLSEGETTESDINRFMEICFRLDGTVDHLLLDEFQDTSISQWNALRPIVAEITAGEGDRLRSFFCVGDVKQSIYGWRHASPEILERLECLIHEDGSPTGIHDAHLAKSWRSSPIVIHCVNRVFGNLPRNEAMRDYPDVAERWNSSFKKHETEKQDAPGYVELRMMQRASNARASQSQRWRTAAKLAADLYHRAPGLSIAVLTRTNKAAGRMLFELGPDGSQELNVPAGGRGKGSLTDAPVIEALLDLLALADHPDDTIAAFHVANSPAAELFDVAQDFAAPANWNARADLSRRLRNAFAERGYAATIAEWIPTLVHSCTQRELGRLLQFIEVAERFDSSGGGGRADQFIKLVEQADIPDVQPAPIQVMTVHKAKGLEFDAVILPDLECKLRGNQNPTVAYERDGDIGQITRICRYVKQELQPLVPELAPMFEATINRTVREHLSLLYVAITRARHGLYMFVDPLSESRPKISPCLSGILVGAYADEQAQPGDVLYQNGDPDWMVKAEARNVPMRAARPEIAPPIRLHKAKRRATKQVDAPSAHQAGPAHFHRPAQRNHDADDRGLAVHAMLQQIEWLDGDAVDDDALLRCVHNAVQRRHCAWCGERVEEFRALLNNVNLRRLLTKSSQLGGADGIEVHRELPFARMIDGSAQRGSIDRLVMRRKNGTISGAEVIDFKTDRFGPGDDVIAHAERYAAQLDDYRAAASRLLRVEAAKIEQIVFFVTVDQAVRLVAGTDRARH